MSVTFTVYPPSGQPLASWDGSEPVAKLASWAYKRAGWERYDRATYRTELLLPRPVEPEALAPVLSRIPPVSLDGGRLHIGATLASGEFLPLSFAFSRAREAASMSAEEALRRMTRYGHGIDDLPIEVEASE